MGPEKISVMLLWFLIVQRDAPPRYITVMATGQGCNVPMANRFSNPAVEYNGKATGNDRCNNALVIKENMVSFLETISPVS